MPNLHQRFTAACMGLFPATPLGTIGKLWRELKDLPAVEVDHWLTVTEALADTARETRRAEVDAITAAIGRPGAAPDRARP